MTRALLSKLIALNKISSVIEASAIFSSDGLVIASTLPSSINEDTIGAMSCAMLSVGKRSSDEFAGGNLEQLFIKSTYGYIVMMLLNKELILTVITKPNDMLEQLFIDIKSSAQHLIV